MATSRADDLAIRALADLSDAIEPVNARIIGGHMVQLLLTAFPTPGTIERRTRDADGGLPPEAAAIGEVHAALTERGYEARPAGGNRYLRTLLDGEDLVVDLLVGDQHARSQPVTIGEHTFDSTPALFVPLTEDPIMVDVTALLTNGEEMIFTTRVPTLEGAVILKAFAWSARKELRDAVDLYNLLLVVRQHKPEVGRWLLDQPPLHGTRLDAARSMTSMIRAARTPLLRGRLDATRLVALIRSLVVEDPR